MDYLRKASGFVRYVMVICLFISGMASCRGGTEPDSKTLDPLIQFIGKQWSTVARIGNDSRQDIHLFVHGGNATGSYLIEFWGKSSQGVDSLFGTKAGSITTGNDWIVDASFTLVGQGITITQPVNLAIGKTRATQQNEWRETDRSAVTCCTP